MCELVDDDGVDRLLFFLEPHEAKSVHAALRTVIRAQASQSIPVLERVKRRIEQYGKTSIWCCCCHARERYPGSGLCDKCRFFYSCHGRLPNPEEMDPKPSKPAEKPAPTKRYRRKPGDPDQRRKLTEMKVAEIRAAKGKKRATELADEYDVHQQTIYSIWQGRIWKVADTPVNGVSSPGHTG